MRWMLLAGLSASWPNCATADNCLFLSQSTHTVQVAEATDLWTWVTDKMEIDVEGKPPWICAVPEEILVSLRYGSDVSVPPAVGIEALYDSASRHVLVSDTWKGLDPASLSVLVHEFVHHAHAVTGRRFACAEHGEKEAYAVQAVWLKQWNLDLQTAIGIDDFTLLVLTTCSYYWF
ncbi:DUF6647 family protein [Tropicimonas sp. IMCC6043]|uniref:DUF6647 family protein n=1 Tax=Tropicimonas sp. IMCC6043 TaxID=2510645 RepID=UPI00101B7FE6|nr:DUF6647 family protein [Tropicimonas sp. IMCC6043]RYH10508.1 hypothetical protein EU800_07095 [Tropicimonas sp. IMCC6043]